MCAAHRHRGDPLGALQVDGQGRARTRERHDLTVDEIEPVKRLDHQLAVGLAGLPEDADVEQVGRFIERDHGERQLGGQREGAERLHLGDVRARWRAGRWRHHRPTRQEPPQGAGAVGEALCRRRPRAEAERGEVEHVRHRIALAATARVRRVRGQDALVGGRARGDEGKWRLRIDEQPARVDGVVLRHVGIPATAECRCEGDVDVGVVQQVVEAAYLGGVGAQQVGPHAGVEAIAGSTPYPQLQQRVAR